MDEYAENFKYMPAIRMVHDATDGSAGTLKIAKTLVDAAKVIGNASAYFQASESLVFVAHNPVFDTFTIQVM